MDIGVHKLIDPIPTNDWEKLIQRTRVLFILFLQRRGILDNAKRLEIAEILWIKQSMIDTQNAVKEGKLKSLLVEEIEGLIVVKGRATKGMSKILGKEYLPVIMKQSRVAYLIMLWAHNKNHDSRDITMSIANSKV